MSRVEEAFMLVEVLHQRFDEAFDRAETLSAAVAARVHHGVDVTMLMGMLKEAETEKKLLLAALRLARGQQAVSPPAPQEVKPPLVQHIAQAGA